MSKMNDVLLEQIEGYEQWLISNRATGRTTRLVDDYVQKFFNEPMNTPIAVQDHYGDRFNYLCYPGRKRQQRHSCIW